MLRQWNTILLLLLALLLALPQATLARSEKSQGSIEEVTAQDAAKLIKDKDLVIMDARTPAEFREGHIKGAQNINLFGTRFEDQVDKLPKSKPVLVYCLSGKRSAGAADILKDLGFKVIHMKDGMQGWKKAGLPVAKN